MRFTCKYLITNIHGSGEDHLSACIFGETAKCIRSIPALSLVSNLGFKVVVLGVLLWLLTNFVPIICYKAGVDYPFLFMQETYSAG